MEKLLIFFSFAPFAAADSANEHPLKSLTCACTTREYDQALVF